MVINLAWVSTISLSLLFKLKKIQEKLRKCQQDVENTKEKYEACLNDLNSYNAKYIEDMNEVCELRLCTMHSILMKSLYNLKY